MPAFSSDVIALKGLHSVSDFLSFDLLGDTSAWDTVYDYTNNFRFAVGTIRIGVNPDFAYPPCIYTTVSANSGTSIISSMDGLKWEAGGAATPGVRTALASDLFGHCGILDSNSGTVRFATDGETFSTSSSLTTANDWVGLGWAPNISVERWIAFGTNKINTAVTAGGSWANRSVPTAWSGVTPLKLIVPPYNSTAVGVILIGDGELDTIVYSTNGLVWTAEDLGGNYELVSGCFSRYYNRWFLLTKKGEVLVSETNQASSDWTKIADFSGVASEEHLDIIASGPCVLILTTWFSQIDGSPGSGNLIATVDLKNWYVASAYAGFNQTLTKLALFNGRILAVGLNDDLLITAQSKINPHELLLVRRL